MGLMSKYGCQRGSARRRLTIEPLENRRLLAVWHVPLGASIQSYIDQAGSGDEIRIAGGTYSNQSLHVINKSLTIMPEASANVVIDAGGQGAAAFFTVADGSTLAGNSSSSRITLRGGASVSDTTSGADGWKLGGGLLAALAHNVTIQFCVITQNTGFAGAGVHIAGSDNFRLLDSEITQNTANNEVYRNASMWGAGVIVSDSTALIQRNLISGNAFSANSTMANGSGITGGGLYVTANAVATIDSNVIENNDGGFGGGGINMTGHGAGSITNNTIRNNAAGYGGGIYFEWESNITAPSVPSPNILVANNVIYGNAAQIRHPDWNGWILTGSGGAAAVYGWTQVTFTGNRMGVDALGAAAGNTAARAGGAILIGEFSACTFQDNTISYNRVDASGGPGGGLFVDGGSVGGYLIPVTLTGNLISHNQAVVGAGLFLSDCNATLTGNQIRDNGDPTRANYATVQGGGLWLQGLGGIVPQFTLTQNVIQDNRAQSEGGVHVEHFSATGATLRAVFNANIIAENESTAAGTRGGNLFVKNARVDLTNNLIRDGKATNGAGVLWDNGAVGKFLNNTIAHNLPYRAGDPGGGLWVASAAPTLVNNVFALNNGYQVSGATPPAYNLSAATDPGFVNWSGQDYQLQSNSGCVNAGNPADYAPADIRSVPRDAQPDLGAYEYSTNRAPTDLALSSVNVAENQPAGTAVGVLSTTDATPPAAPFAYALVSGSGSGDNASFTIAADGTLRTAGSFDYETTNSYSIRVRVTDQGGLSYEEAFTISVADLWDVTTCGAYDPQASRFFLKFSNSEGFADVEFGYGAPGWKPLAGDWNGDGRDTIGLFQPEVAQFYLRNSNSGGSADVSFGYGDPSQGAQYVLVMGDWNADGVDTVGLYHKPSATWFLRNTNSEGVADLTIGFGVPGSAWTPVVGDWNGDGADTIGLYDPATGMFYLRNSHTTGIADVAFPFGATNSGWTPLIGDWNGDGAESAGFYQPGDASHFYLRNQFTAGLADQHFGLAFAGVQPIVGNWLGPTGQTLLAVGGGQMAVGSESASLAPSP